MNMTHSSDSSLTRRNALKWMGGALGVAALGSTGGQAASSGASASAQVSGKGTPQPFTLPPLGYAYTALEPAIDARTMEIHYTKHHQAYIDAANKALAGQTALQSKTAEELVSHLDAVPESLRTVVRNQVGGHLNHSLFWKILTPGGKSTPVGGLAAAITAAFGSYETFKQQFADAATKRFGSGWAWLVWKDGRVAVTSSANQDSPLMEKAVPLVGLDVWEHAYYLKYQNRRADYIQSFWPVVNWEVAESLFQALPDKRPAVR